jgi:hypothetical protein
VIGDSAVNRVWGTAKALPYLYTQQPRISRAAEGGDLAFDYKLNSNGL